MKHELQSIISGNGSVRNGEIIQSITSYLRREKNTISYSEEKKINKSQEERILIDFIDTKSLWYKEIDDSRYVGEGAEQKIYECNDKAYVFKLNDTIFYEFWEDYWYNFRRSA